MCIGSYEGFNHIENLMILDKWGGSERFYDEIYGLWKDGKGCVKV